MLGKAAKVHCSLCDPCVVAKEKDESNSPEFDQAVDLLVADISTGEIKRLFEGVSGCEITGIAMTPDRSTLFCNVQHPDPTTGIPRDATVVLERRNGGIVGS